MHPDRAEKKAGSQERNSVEDLQQELNRVLAENRELREKNRRLEQIALEDPLTGLYNRRAFEEELPRRLAQLQRFPGEKMVVLMVDVDNFKRVNDKYGHAQGDAVLVSIAEMLKAQGRESDYYVRISGDEFAAILPMTIDTTPEKVETALKRFNEASRQINRSGNPENPDPQTVSIGGVLVDSQTAASWQEILAAADGNLYHSKEQGRDRMTLSTFSSAHKKG